jgi:hypothetical protein
MARSFAVSSVLAVLTLLLMVLTGCGYADSSARSSGAGATRDSLVAKAIAICRRLDDEVATLVENAHASQAKHGPSAEETLQLMRGRGTAERAAFAQLNELSAQPSKDPDWQRILADKRTVATTMWQLGLAQLHHDRSRERVLTTVLAGIERRLKAAAARHKLARCAELE